MNTKGSWFSTIICSKTLVLCLFVLLGTAAYLNSLHNMFQYDDYFYVTYNKSIRSLNNLPQFFTNPRLLISDHQAGHYRPLVLLSYAINYALGGLDTFGYHLTNLIFHIGTAFLLFLIVKTMLEGMGLGAEVRSKKLEARSRTSADIQRDKNVPPIDSRGFLTPMFVASVASGLIFLVHPFNSEAVNYITARSSVMSGFFYLLGFYCWVKFRSQKSEVRSQQTEERSKKLEARSKIGEDLRGSSNFLPLTSYFYIASFLAFLAGMLSKEVVITLPIVFWLYDIYWPNRSKKQEVRSQMQEDKTDNNTAHRSPLNAGYILNWRTYIPYLPFILIVVIPYFLMRFFSLGGVLTPFKRDVMTQLYTELPVLVKHWRLFLFPTGLTFGDVIGVRNNLWSFEIVLSACFVIVYLILAVYLFLRNELFARISSFFMFWFLIVIIPTTIIPLNVIFQENRGYLAIVSFAVLTGIVISTFLNKLSAKPAFVILIILIGVYFGGTVARNRVWNSEVGLWKDTIDKYPESSKLYIALGVAYTRANMYNDALDALNKAFDLGGGKDPALHEALGKIYIVQKKWDLAAIEYEKMIQVRPDYSGFRNDLGAIYFNIGKLDLAEVQYKRAQQLDHLDYLPHFNLGVLYTEKGMLKEAVKEYNISIALYPDYVKARFNLAELLEELGDKAGAREYYSYIVKQKGSEDRELTHEAGLRLANLMKL
ncbi:MAG: tetratricopeptide repeat protein [Nitrospirae bacterium]|nr:tetratricopeptide repeat protein [Nitrospirota bacterium]